MAIGLMLILLGYTQVKNPKSCQTDDDCASGVHKDTGDCFFGNKLYVDVSRQCPDFCNGIAAHLSIKCIDNECRQINNLNEKKECTQDADCVEDSCCHATGCTAKENKPNCGEIGCTMECAPGTLDCGQGACKCDMGKCKAEFY